jgi:hypothetical protein
MAENKKPIEPSHKNPVNTVYFGKKQLPGNAAAVIKHKTFLLVISIKFYHHQNSNLYE